MLIQCIQRTVARLQKTRMHQSVTVQYTYKWAGMPIDTGVTSKKYTAHTVLKNTTQTIFVAARTVHRTGFGAPMAMRAEGFPRIETKWR